MTPPWVKPECVEEYERECALWILSGVRLCPEYRIPVLFCDAIGGVVHDLRTASLDLRAFDVGWLDGVLHFQEDAMTPPWPCKHGGRHDTRLAHRRVRGGDRRRGARWPADLSGLGRAVRVVLGAELRAPILRGLVREGRRRNPGHLPNFRSVHMQRRPADAVVARHPRNGRFLMVWSLE